MPQIFFEITYADKQTRKFSNASQARKFLEAEKEIWSPFLEEIVVDNPLIQKLNGLSLSHAWSFSAKALEKPFEPVLRSLEDGEERNTRRDPRQYHLPPPSDSLIGRLMLGFFEDEKFQQARDTYVYFFGNFSRVPVSSDLLKAIERAKKFLPAAQVVESMPFAKVSAQKISGVKRSLDAQLAAVQEEVEKLQELRAALSDDFDTLKDEKSSEFSAEMEARNAEAHEMRGVEHEMFADIEK
ncbi:hypothetical protein [Celeribacter sp.]|uniref:hypothetical protein n=1 Tax=Celeribacter sp. TaxID=1890673 RepID=UPI003A916F23